jgi:hypothetical protein
MIITMTVVRMVKASIHQIVDVVPVRNRLVPAARPVRMTGADILWCAMSRVGSVNCYHVLVDMISMHVMQMTIVQVVNVAFVLNRRVSTPRAMLMGMIGVFLFSASRHGLSRLMNAHPLQPLFASPAMGICDKSLCVGWLRLARQNLIPVSLSCEAKEKLQGCRELSSSGGRKPQVTRSGSCDCAPTKMILPKATTVPQSA